MTKKGFTLIEILVSAFILALVMTGLTYVFVAAKRQILHSRSRIQAAELGQLFLGPLQMDVREDNWASNCLSGDGTTPPCPGTQTIEDITYTPSYNISGVTGNTLRKVKVTINWTEPSS